MTSDGTTSSRHAIPVPGDGQDETADDSTQARNVSDPDAENWGDLLQTALLDDNYIDGKLVGSGTLAGRPAAGPGAPKLYVVTDGGDSSDQPYLTYNDDSAWYLAAHLPFRSSITDADSPYSISEGETVWVDASSAAVTVNLPALADGLACRVVVTDATNNVTVSRNGTESIDGSASGLTISSQRDVELQSDGTDWRLATDTADDPQAQAGDSLTKSGDTLNIEPADFAGSGLEDDGSDNLQVNTVTTGTATLSSGTATVSTGLTTTGVALGIYLDPSGNGNNTADVKVAARAFWDNSAGEYKVEIVEDETSVGNPDIGYRIVRE